MRYVVREFYYKWWNVKIQIIDFIFLIQLQYSFFGVKYCFYFNT